MEAVSEPTAGERRQFLILILVTLLINLVAAWQTPRGTAPADAVPLGELVIDAAPGPDGRMWGEPIAEPGRQAASQVVLNQADRSALLACPGIGPVTADRLLAARREGPFLSWDDLSRRVPGLGETRIAQLRAAGVRLNP